MEMKNDLSNYFEKENNITFKECPFCGEKEEVRIRKHGIWGVHCTCGASICGFETKEEAVTAWNTRKVVVNE